MQSRSTELKAGSKLQFGASTRIFVLSDTLEDVKRAPASKVGNSFQTLISIHKKKPLIVDFAMYCWAIASSHTLLQVLLCKVQR